MVSHHSDMNRDASFLEEIRHVSFQPVFILGLHRSGTSILYKMLTATGCFNPVTAYHLINYDELLSNYHENMEHDAKQKLTESLLKNGLTDRGIDRLKVTADFAEEYGFLLGTQTIKMSLTKRNVRLFTELCKKIQFIAGNDKPILLKNPYDFSNFLFIKQLFPTAKFVFIHRHPLKTISSTLNAIRTIVKEKNPYTAKLSKIYDRWYTNPLLHHALRFIFWTVPECGVMLITRITAHATSCYLKNIGNLSSDDYISITYEALCQHPQETLEYIMEKLSVSMTSNIDAALMINPRRVHVERNVQRLRNHIYRSMNKYFEKFSYTIEADENITFFH
ncbi:hypothetical protein AYK25_08965 [Thermoplasmatales archaeon SM1-50]|nr:MAG: hypothetical protein AYK25_08965 [Thermoplasmatales archaeon SM1-50]